MVESENISRTSEAFNDNNESCPSIDNPKRMDGQLKNWQKMPNQNLMKSAPILSDLADKKFKILSPGFSLSVTMTDPLKNIWNLKTIKLGSKQKRLKQLV